MCLCMSDRILVATIDFRWRGRLWIRQRLIVKVWLVLAYTWVALELQIICFRIPLYVTGLVPSIVYVWHRFRGVSSAARVISGVFMYTQVLDCSGQTLPNLDNGKLLIRINGYAEMNFTYSCRHRIEVISRLWTRSAPLNCECISFWTTVTKIEIRCEYIPGERCSDRSFVRIKKAMH